MHLLVQTVHDGEKQHWLSNPLLHQTDVARSPLHNGNEVLDIQNEYETEDTWLLILTATNHHHQHWFYYICGEEGQSTDDD